MLNMLDRYIEVLWGHEKQAAEQRKLVDLLGRLPIDELDGLASGRTKLAFSCGDDGEWLEKFKGTPLLEQAIQLEQEQLQLEAQQISQRQESRQSGDQEAMQRDQLNVRRKLLDIELARMESGGGEGAEPSGPPPAPGQPPQLPSTAGSPVASAAPPDERPKMAARLIKTAAELSKEVHAELAKAKASGDQHERRRVLHEVTKHSELEEKAAAMRMQLAVAQLEKAGAGVLGALKGGYNVLRAGMKGGLSSGAARAGFQAAEPGVMAGLKNVAHYGTEWAKKNPGAALGTAAVGAGLVGAGVGHATA
jgi:hypothetical protein